MPTCEIMTTDIIRDLLNSGMNNYKYFLIDFLKQIYKIDKNCFIPRCTKNNMDMVQINDINDFESLPINKWNIPEPPLDQSRSNGKN
jgi:5-formyltetrahydrofolate cyclo-ligase